MKSRQFYEKMEKQHAFHTTLIIKILVGIMVPLYILTALFPISYAVFGSPQPEIWPLPVEIQYVYCIFSLKKSKFLTNLEKYL